jgi:hypothetical protein
MSNQVDQENETETETTAIALPTRENILAVEDPQSAGSDKQPRTSIPYVGYYGAGAEEKTRGPLDAVGVKPGTFYLHHIEPIRVEPFGMHLLKYTRLFTRRDPSMRVESAVPQNTDETFRQGYREHLFGVALVRIPAPGQPTKFCPALFNLYGGLAAALNKAIEYLPLAKRVADFAARSPMHAAAARAIHPGLRFLTTIEASVEPIKGSKKTFNLGEGSVRPTPEADIAELNSWIEDAKKFSVIQRFVAIHEGRVKEARDKMVSED